MPGEMHVAEFDDILWIPAVEFGSHVLQGGCLIPGRWICLIGMREYHVE